MGNWKITDTGKLQLTTTDVKETEAINKWIDSNCLYKVLESNFEVVYCGGIKDIKSQIQDEKDKNGKITDHCF